MSNAVQEFSRFAHEYDSYNVIQAEVAKTLVKMIPVSQHTTVLDIGCGRGEVYKNIVTSDLAFENFIALDSSLPMLTLHPSAHTIRKIHADFNTLDGFATLSSDDNSLILSSSALQWSKDLDFTLGQMAQKSPSAYVAVFTANTFKTLHQTAGISSPIYSGRALRDTIEKYYTASFELKEYRLSFESIREMFHYIKKSGVSGGEKHLSYKQTKELMMQYPLDYLEFEVLFVKGDSLVYKV